MRLLRALALSLLVSAAALAQNAALMPMPKLQFFSQFGTPLSGGLIYTYAAGTTTPLATYTDSTGATQNPNPIVLDSGGFGAIWLGSSAYKISANTAAGVNIWTVDNVTNNGLALSGSLGGSNGATLIKFTAPSTGAVSRTVAAKLSDTVSVKDFGATGNGTTDDTAAIQQAIADAATCQTVYFPAGTYKITSTLTISKCVTLQGAGGGGLTVGPTQYNTFGGASVILNAAAAANAITVQPVAGTWISDATIRDLAIQGNQAVGGATAGDNIVLAGGSDAIRHFLLSNVASYQAFGAGLRVQDNTYGFSAIHFMSYHNGGNGISIVSTNCVGINCTGQPSSLNFTDCWSDLNTGDALQLSSPNAADVTIVGGFYADSSNGINVTSAAVNATLNIMGSHVEHNTGKGIWLAGGYAHQVVGTQVNGDGTQLYGVYVDNPGSNFLQISAHLVGNVIESNATNDVLITANAKNVRLEGGDTTLGHYNISDAGYLTQWIGAPYHQYTKNSYTLNGLTPCVVLQDTTGSQSTPNKSVCSGLGYLRFLNSSGTAIAQLSDSGAWQFLMGSGSFLLTGSPTATRTVTFPDTNGTVLEGLTGGQTASIGGSALASGACATGSTSAITGLANTMALIATAVTDPGPWFVIHATYNGSGGVNVAVCNVSGSSQTPAASVYNVRAIQ